MNTIAFIAPAVANPLAVYSVVALLAFWAVWSGVRLERRSTKFQNILDSARRRLERAPDPAAFAQDYEAIRSDLSGRPVIGERWKDFCNSLLVVERPAPRVGATSRIGNWFDLGLLRADPVRLDLRYHAALPNLLVGAGLLFTFLGLTVALYAAGAVVDGEPAQRNAALKTLLDTASFKFITSLVGLALSIAYALWRKRALRRSEKSLDRFVAAIEARVPIVTPALLQLTTNEILERQASHLESFSTDLALGIGSALDRVFDQRLGEHIAPLTKAMERLAAKTVDDNHSAMQSMLDAFLHQLQGGAGEHLNEVAGTLATLGNRLEAMQAGLGEVSGRMAQSAEAMATRMGEGAEAALGRITDQFGDLANSLRASAEQTRAAGAEASSEMASRIEKAASGFEEAALGAAGGFSEKARALGAQVTEFARIGSTITASLAEFEKAAREASSPLAMAAADLKEASRNARESVEPLVQIGGVITRSIDQIAGATHGLETTGAAAAKLMEGMTIASNRFEGVDRELSNVFDELQKGLQAFTQQIAVFVNQTDQNLAKAATQLGNLVKGLQDSVDEFVDARERVH